MVLFFSMIYIYIYIYIKKDLTFDNQHMQPLIKVRFSGNGGVILMDF